MPDQDVATYVKISGTHLPVDVFVKNKDDGYSLDLKVRVPTPETPNYVISDLLSDNPFYVAHRCGGGNWPEFSERGIVNSRNLGYKAVEMSVYRCQSGEFVLSHDNNTLRMTGENYQIRNTPWGVLSTLTSTAANTSDPTQSRTPLLRLQDALALAEGMVVFLDHKQTVDSLGSADGQANRDALLDFMDSIPNSKETIVWKCFKGGYPGADLAKARGYMTWGAYYGEEITTSPTHLESFDILGLQYNDAQEYWDVAKATGKPIIGHIVTSLSQRNSAISRGARGLMNSVPLLMP